MPRSREALEALRTRPVRPSGRRGLPARGADRSLPRVLRPAFAFDLLHSEWTASRSRGISSNGKGGRSPGSTSNHDFPRAATPLGRETVRAAAVLLLTLRGTAFVYQGEEIGMIDGPGGRPPLDRFGRDACRQPMQWDSAPGRVQRRGALAPGGRPRVAQRRAQRRRSRLDAEPFPRADRAAPRARAGRRGIACGRGRRSTSVGETRSWSSTGRRRRWRIPLPAAAEPSFSRPRDPTAVGPVERPTAGPAARRFLDE